MKHQTRRHILDSTPSLQCGKPNTEITLGRAPWEPEVTKADPRHETRPDPRISLKRQMPPRSQAISAGLAASLIKQIYEEHQGRVEN